MKYLLEKLQHQLDRSGLSEGHRPWIEVNMGNDGQPRVALRESVETLRSIEKQLVQHLQKARDLPSGAQLIYSINEGATFRDVMVSVSPPTVRLTERALEVLGRVVKKNERRLGASGRHGVKNLSPGRGNYVL